MSAGAQPARIQPRPEPPEPFASYSAVAAKLALTLLGLMIVGVTSQAIVAPTSAFVWSLGYWVIVSAAGAALLIGLTQSVTIALRRRKPG